MCKSRLRDQSKHCIEFPYCLLQAVTSKVDHPQHIPCICELAVNRQGRLELPNSILRSTRMCIHITQIVMSHRIVRIEQKRSFIGPDRISWKSFLQVHLPQIYMNAYLFRTLYRRIAPNPYT